MITIYCCHNHHCHLHQNCHLYDQENTRNVLGTLNLGEILSQRESIANEMKAVLDVATAPWGVMVERVEVKILVILMKILTTLMKIMVIMAANLIIVVMVVGSLISLIRR